MNLKLTFAPAAALTAVLVACTVPLHAAALDPVHKHCTITPSEDARQFSLHLDDGNCLERNSCGSNFSTEGFSRFSGISLSDLANEGAHLTATLTGEAGKFTCTGTVHQNALAGDAVFTPDASFVSRMADMGFKGFDSDKLMACAFLDVQTEWIRSVQKTGIRGMTSDNVMALHIFKVDPEYIHGIVALGYELPTADQLIGLRVQGVNAEEVREIRAMGYQPSLDDLIQIRIFKITPEFIKRMQARGLKNLTIAKLVQIRIFNLAD